MAHYNLQHGGAPKQWGGPGFGMLPSVKRDPYEFQTAAAHYRPSTFMVNRHLWFGGGDYYRRLEGEAFASEALEQFTRDLRAQGKTIEAGDTLGVISLPIDFMLRAVYFRNMAVAEGVTAQLEVWDKDDNVVHTFPVLDLGKAHLLESVNNPKTYLEQFVAPMAMPSQAELEAAAGAADAVQAMQDAAATLAAVIDGSDTTTPAATATEAFAATTAAAGANAAASTPTGVGFYLGHNYELVLRILTMPEPDGETSAEPITIEDVKAIVAAELVVPWMGAW